VNTPLTRTADPRRDLPAGEAARRDVIDAAIGSLHDEQRRLERIGFELPLARCHDQLRYWQFLSGLFAAAATPDRPLTPSRAWRVDGSR
jgi:hypothetical protein